MTDTSVVDFGLTRDGLVQLRRRWVARQPRAVALLLHGVAEHSGRYEHVGSRLARAGIDVVAIDQRGFGQSGGRRGHVDRFAEYLDDVHDQLLEVRALGLTTVLIGHSMGGLISLSYALEAALGARPRPDLLVLSGPALDADIQRLQRLLAPFLARLAPTLRVPARVAPDMLATDPRVGEAYAADPLVTRRVTPSFAAALLRQMAWVAQHRTLLDVPTLVLHGAEDRLVPSRHSQALAELPGVTRRALPGLRHEVLNEPNRDETLDLVITWIEERLPAAA